MNLWGKGWTSGGTLRDSGAELGIGDDWRDSRDFGAESVRYRGRRLEGLSGTLAQNLSGIGKTGGALRDTGAESVGYRGGGHEEKEERRKWMRSKFYQPHSERWGKMNHDEIGVCSICSYPRRVLLYYNLATLSFATASHHIITSDHHMTSSHHIPNK